MLVMGPGGRANEGLSANLVRTMRPRASACPPCSIWDGAGLLGLTTQDSCPVKAVLDLPSGALPSHLLQLWTINRDARHPGKGDGVESHRLKLLVGSANSMPICMCPQSLGRPSWALGQQCSDLSLPGGHWAADDDPHTNHRPGSGAEGPGSWEPYARTAVPDSHCVWAS